jgi:hypothetical protein
MAGFVTLIAGSPKIGLQGTSPSSRMKELSERLPVHFYQTSTRQVQEVNANLLASGHPLKFTLLHHNLGTLLFVKVFSHYVVIVSE